MKKPHPPPHSSTCSAKSSSRRQIHEEIHPEQVHEGHHEPAALPTSAQSRLRLRLLLLTSRGRRSSRSLRRPTTSQGLLRLFMLHSHRRYTMNSRRSNIPSYPIAYHYALLDGKPSGPQGGERKRWPTDLHRLLCLAPSPKGYTGVTHGGVCLGLARTQVNRYRRRVCKKRIKTG